MPIMKKSATPGAASDIFISKISGCRTPSEGELGVDADDSVGHHGDNGELFVLHAA